jgi:hypothetical protein
MIEKYDLKDRYDRFVLTRSDHFYKCVHDLGKLDPAFIWVPEGQDFGGVTDRHVVCNSGQIMKAIDIYPNVLRHPTKYVDRSLVHANPEQLIALRWKEENLWDDLRRFDPVMFTCAEDGDKTEGQGKSSKSAADGVMPEQKPEKVQASAEKAAEGVLAEQKTEKEQASRVATVSIPPTSSLFPREPKLTPGCTVKFQHTNMSLCYFLPHGANFGDELGPAAVKRILEYHHGCSVADVHIIDMAGPSGKEKRNNRTCLFSVGSVFHYTRVGDHVWGTGINPRHQGPHPKWLHVHAVRGNETERMMKEWYKYKSVPYGDPGTSMSRSTVLDWRLCHSNLYLLVHRVSDSKSLPGLLSLADKVNRIGTWIHTTEILLYSSLS